MTLVTLLYIKNNNGDFLLIERKKEPNKDMLSPPGGKLEIEKAELPIDCARREAFEECGLTSSRDDWKLIGTASEKDYPKAGNMLLFFYEYTKTLNELPPEINEGAFRFVSKNELMNKNIPETDRKFFWKKILENSSNPFEISLDCNDGVVEIKEN